jgi:nucleoside-diphosphate-sugar epimerase
MVSKEKILLVGGSGMLGKQIAEDLSKEFQIVIFDRNKRTNFETAQFDVLNKSKFEEEFTKHEFKAAIHLVGSRTVSETKEDVSKIFDLNIVSLNNLIEACENSKTKIIFLSSAAVYGNSPTPHSEQNLPSPENIYGLIKFLCEEFLIRKCLEKRIKYTILRGFSIYSEKDSRLLIGNLFNAIKENTPITLFNENQIRDFISIEDLNRIIIQVIQRPESNNQIINAGSGIGHSIEEIIQMFKEQKNLKFKIVKGPRAYDSLADITKLRKICDIQPKDILPDIRRRLEE